MKIITLTTDFGLRDYSVAAVKGALYSKCPNATIVDISHLISPFNILETFYILQNSYMHFPKGSIHIIGVDTERTATKKHLLMSLNGHYFIGADNGIFHLLSENFTNVALYEFNTKPSTILFSTLNSFTSIAEQIYKGTPLDQIGIPIEKCNSVSYFKPEVSTDENFIHGIIIYIDHYGNAVSNISHSLFEETRKGRNFEVIFNLYSFKKVYNNYSEINDDGKMMILFNELNLLQCSIYKSDTRSVGGASSLLGINCLDRVIVQFK
ncbi:SAM hydrolase/SAM-dependent halogenase family protein [Capnocytophaga sputigena]|jgi:protein containing DUF62|uniref:SAM hydrolase/SAM-dependent halogenase family protein n=1 Tax=Capnocytophaga sputigena TaxID=1019 RepID=UPI00248D4F0F|nr:SAM-dependent chlorinase/fluorinase [Capnocytophaga sputigena]